MIANYDPTLHRMNVIYIIRTYLFIYLFIFFWGWIILQYLISYQIVQIFWHERYPSDMQKSIIAQLASNS